MSLVQSNVRSGRYHYDIGFIAALLHFHVFSFFLLCFLFIYFFGTQASVWDLVRSMRVSVGISIQVYVLHPVAQRLLVSFITFS